MKKKAGTVDIKRMVVMKGSRSSRTNRGSEKWIKEKKGEKGKRRLGKNNPRRGVVSMMGEAVTGMRR